MTMLLPVIVFGAALVAAPPQSPATGRAGGSGSVATATAVSTRQAPAIDGRNDDPVWRDAPRFSEFRQFEPRVDVDCMVRLIDYAVQARFGRGRRKSVQSLRPSYAE